MRGYGCPGWDRTSDPDTSGLTARCCKNGSNLARILPSLQFSFPKHSFGPCRVALASQQFPRSMFVSPTRCYRFRLRRVVRVQAMHKILGLANVEPTFSVFQNVDPIQFVCEVRDEGIWLPGLGSNQRSRHVGINSQVLQKRLEPCQDSSIASVLFPEAQLRTVSSSSRFPTVSTVHVCAFSKT